MKAHTTILFALLLLATPLTGCIESLGDDELDSNSADLTAVGVDVTATGGADAGVNYLILGIGRVLVHVAGGNETDWLVLQEPASQAVIVRAGAADTAVAADGSVPVGSYDAVMIEIDSIRTEAAGGDEHSHDQGGDTGGHGHAVEKNVTLQIGAPVNLTLDGSGDVRVTLTVDAAASDVASDTPRIAVAEATVTVAGEIVSTVDVATAGGLPNAKPPVARVSLFGPDGALQFKSDFVAEGGEFVNSIGSAFAPGDQLRFVGTDSEVQVGGTQIVEFAWDFDDGNREVGGSVSHAYDGPGVYDVTLTVTDDRGVADSVNLILVVLPTSSIDVFTTFSFDDGGSGFTAASTAHNPADGSTTGEGQWTWQLTDEGNASTGWQLGGETPEPAGSVLGGTAATNVATLTSPSFTVPDGIFVGYSLDYVGASGGDLLLQFSMDGGSTWETLTEFSAAAEWSQVSDNEALTAHAGHEAQVRLLWTSGGPSTDTGWTVDNFVIHGVAYDSVQNGELLKGSSGDGHDHQH